MNNRDHYRQAVYQTPFHSRTAPLCLSNEWHRWMDYTTADVYTDTELEYTAIRNATGVFDLSPMTKHRISGPDACAYLDRLVTRNVSRLKPGRVGYAVWCDDEGQVIDDGTIFHLRDGEYRLCSQEHQLDWLLTNAIGFDVEIREETHEVAALAVQGPTSCAALRAMGLEGIENLKPFGMLDFDMDGAGLMVSRTGFTGDLGYEVWTDPSQAETLWDALFAAGQDYGIMPIGTHALEMVRIEAGFIQAGVDFLPADGAVRPGVTRSPLELGLQWLVDFDKPVFNGRRALLAERDRGSRYRLVRLNIEGNKPADGAYVYNRYKGVIGTVTSAVWSASAKANVALASVRMPWGRPDDVLWAEIYYQRELQWNKMMARCSVVEGPFFDPPRRRATPAPDF